MRINIAIVIGSTRQLRVSSRLAVWVQNTAVDQHSDHDWKLVDLRDFYLPMFDEPRSPQSNNVRELADGTKRYLEDIAWADAYIIVTPEYNHGMPAVLKNALDVLDYQLKRKPVAIVSHGSVGGARANEHVRLIVNSALGAVPIPASLPFSGRVAELIDDSGASTSWQEVNQAKLIALLNELIWYSSALKEARENE